MHAADLKHSSATLESKLTRLYNLSPHKRIDMSFRPEYIELLQSFGNPHKKLPPTIHVAGTNGKGSTIAMLRAVLESGGYKVHAYTSPHLIDFNERIYLSGKNISNEALETLVDRALALNAGRETTFFEITTAMAFAAFAETPADILLCEVGLGGRLDCTNIMPHPLLSIITTVSYDHMEFLGETLPQIAAEKAGIMKRGTPCVLGAQEHPESLQALIQIAVEKGVDLVQTQEKPLPAIPNLIGHHQLSNAQTVLAALDAIKDKFPLESAKVQHGFQNVIWPARLQHIDKQQILSKCELWYDGGHNESAAKILARQLRVWQQEDRLPLHLIVGMKANKQADAFISHLAPYAASITLITLPDMASVQTLAVPFTHAASLNEAFQKLAKVGPARILLCGSLYLAEPLAKALI